MLNLVHAGLPVVQAQQNHYQDTNQTLYIFILPACFLYHTFYTVALLKQAALLLLLNTLGINICEYMYTLC